MSIRTSQRGEKSSGRSGGGSHGRARRNDERDVYRDALAYDIIHEPGTRVEVGALVRVAGRFVPNTGGRFNGSRAVWLEPACGSGRCVREIVRRGGGCVGVDLEQGMVEFARASLPAERGGLGRVVLGDMRRMDAADVMSELRALGAGGGAGNGKAVVAFCPHNSIRHLRSDADMIEHLSSMARVLRRFGGVYLVGIGLFGPGGETACETVYTGKRRGVEVREIIDFVPPEIGATGVEARFERAYKHVTITERRGGRVSEREITSAYTLRTYTRAQWLKVVKASGLVELGVAGAWGEVFDDSRLHYAYRVLGPAPEVGADSTERKVRSKKSPMRRSASKRSSKMSR